MIRHEDIDDGSIFSKPHKICCCHSLCFACNFLFHCCRVCVSRKKRRYEKDGFDLDLVYMTPRIIIHGFPATGLEHIYRNPRYEIKRLLETKHRDHYKMFNFCCEPGRGYDPKVFEGRVERYPFKDHNTPPLETMVEFANSGKLWLDADPLNVVSMHCKAGKGRAGLMVCVMMLREGVVQTAQEAFDKYDNERVTNKRGLTVTSQRKFVLFYEMLWRKHWGQDGNLGQIKGEPIGSPKRFIIPEQPVMRVTKIEILNLDIKKWPSLRIKAYKGTNFCPELLFDSGKLIYSVLSFSCDFVVNGNFKISAEQPNGIWKPKKLLEFWHNTLFVDQGVPSQNFPADQLDIKRKVMKTLDNSISLRLTFSNVTSRDIAFETRETIPLRVPPSLNQV